MYVLCILSDISMIALACEIRDVCFVYTMWHVCIYEMNICDYMKNDEMIYIILYIVWIHGMISCNCSLVLSTRTLKKIP